DGSWSATVIRQQTSIFGTTDMFLQVEGQSGRVLWRRRIEQRDMWSDVEARFAELLIDDGRVWVGSHSWGQGGYYELSKADAEAGHEIPTTLNAPGPAGQFVR